MEAIEAVYEGGVFRLARPLALGDGTRVSLVVLPPSDRPEPISDGEARPRGLAARLRDIAGAAPEGSATTSDATGHDAILYGPGAAR